MVSLESCILHPPAVYSEGNQRVNGMSNPHLRVLTGLEGEYLPSLCKAFVQFLEPEKGVVFNIFRASWLLSEDTCLRLSPFLFVKLLPSSLFPQELFGQGITLQNGII